MRIVFLALQNKKTTPVYSAIQVNFGVRNTTPCINVLPFLRPRAPSLSSSKSVPSLNMAKLSFFWPEHIMLSWSVKDNALTLPLQTTLLNTSLQFDPSTVYKTSAFSADVPSSE
ncbi:hypothetical protein V8G54_012142 [Vigna mungo]|uniref:Uncharacterized protein n=1 Tax=Vigna mungo TaxID=3915 RepID=A0AAQ3NQS9_VIGMU